MTEPELILESSIYSYNSKWWLATRDPTRFRCYWGSSRPVQFEYRVSRPEIAWNRVQIRTTCNNVLRGENIGCKRIVRMCQFFAWARVLPTLRANGPNRQGGSFRSFSLRMCSFFCSFVSHPHDFSTFLDFYRHEIATLQMTRWTTPNDKQYWLFGRMITTTITNHYSTNSSWYVSARP